MFFRQVYNEFEYITIIYSPFKGGIILEQLWKDTARFHGHECPGLAIGFKAALAAREYFEISSTDDEDLVCISENDACGIDAIQYLLKCTVGKGNLLIKMRGKSAYNFFDRTKNRSIRLVLKDMNKDMTREEKQNYILNHDSKELFDYTEVRHQIPEKARIFNNVTCSNCGEKLAEHFARIQDNKPVCLDCFTEYKIFD